MEDDYGILKNLIQDQVKDDQIKEAEVNFQKLMRLGKDIKLLKNMEVEEANIKMNTRI